MDFTASQLQTAEFYADVSMQSFDYFETENEEFLRQQSQADPRVSDASKILTSTCTGSQQCLWYLTTPCDVVNEVKNFLVFF